MQPTIIDINADVGEGVGNESQLMPYISSCNIACGGHAGDDKSMQEVIRLAKDHGVKIGAHPSFPDRENFGRQAMEISCAALFKTLEDQTCALIDNLDKLQANLHHIKLHGALYNKVTKDEKTATVVIEFMKSFAFPVYLYVPYKSIIADVAIKNNIPIIYEAFADRNYNRDLSLVLREEYNAVIQDTETMFNHVHDMITKKTVTTIDGSKIPIKAHTYCIHGDNPNAIKLLSSLHKKLGEHHIQVI